MNSPESRKFFYENLCHCENTPFMHIRIREKISNGPMGRGLRDVTRRQFIKTSTGKILFLPSGLTIKKQGEWLQRSVLGPPLALARPTDEVGLVDLPKTRKSRERPTVHYCWTEMLYSNPRKYQYFCAANTYRLALLNVIQSYLQNRGRRSVDG